MVSEAHKLTYADYLQMPDDGHRYEIIQGELLVSPAPSLLHQRVLQNLLRRLDDFVITNNLGWVIVAPVTVRLTPDEPVEPDVVYVSLDRGHILTDAAVNGVPDFVGEVLSPSNPGRDRVVKFNRYAQVGVLEYVIIDPVGRTVDQFQLVERQYERVQREPGQPIRFATIPGFEITISELFDRPGPKRPA